MDDDHGTYEQKQKFTVVYSALRLGTYRAVRLFCKRAVGKQKNFIVRVSRELQSLCVYIYWTLRGSKPSKGDFPFPEMSRKAPGPPQILLSGCWGSFSGIDRPGREVNHLPSSGAEVKNEWSYTSSPSVNLHGMYRNIFILLTNYKSRFNNAF
jgi:hypothetical protein